MHILVRGNEITVSGEPADSETRRAALRGARGPARAGPRAGPRRCGSKHRDDEGGSDARPRCSTTEVVRGRKTVRPKTAGQKRYVDAVADEHDHVRHRPGRHRQELPRGRARGAGAPGEGGATASSSPVPRSRRASGSGSCPATCSPRSTRTCVRSTTRSTTCSIPKVCARLMERGVIEVAPLAYMRGRTLNDSFIILDEAQNTTAEQMKMFLTRLGFGSKVVVTGDVTQIDLPEGGAAARACSRCATCSRASTGSRSSSSDRATSSATRSSRTSSTPTRRTRDR